MPINPRNLLCFALAPLLLSGCIVQSKIQGKYIEASDKCRAEAQAQPPASPPPGTPAEDPNIALARQFSECMNKAGWHVAAPKPSTPLPPSNPSAPVATLPTMPAVAPAPRVNAPASPVVNGAAPAAPILGPGVQPAPAPATASPSTYLPGRPTDEDNSYGNGAGRQF